MVTLSGQRSEGSEYTREVQEAESRVQVQVAGVRTNDGVGAKARSQQPQVSALESFQSRDGVELRKLRVDRVRQYFGDSREKVLCVGGRRSRLVPLFPGMRGKQAGC